MKKILLVIRTEIVNVFTRRSYLFFTFGLPVLIFLSYMVFSNINQSGNQVISNLLAEKPVVIQTEGYIDPGNIIQIFPDEIAEGTFLEFSNEDLAKDSLEKGLISAYYLITEDIFQTGEIIYVRPDFNPLSDNGQDWQMRQLLTLNLFDGNSQRASLIQYPVFFNQKPLDPSTLPADESSIAFIVPYATTIIFYIVILSSSGLLLNSVVNEKQNQVIEVIMLSVSPLQLLTGKIAGLGLVGLMQSIIYSSVGYVLLKLSGRTTEIPAQLNLPPSILIWVVVFFLAGFMIYASLMAGLGALVPNIREASQSTIIVIAPLIIPMFFISIILERPHGIIATILSIFPLTAPVAMMTRLASGGVPIWQPFVALILSIFTAMIIIRIVSGFFRSQILLSGQDFKASLFFKAMLGKI